MEEQVGMMEYNEKYKQSVYEADELFEESKISASKEVLLSNQKAIGIEHNSFKQLNPASTTSSFEQ